MLKYGEDYPDACPPSEANEMEGSFYRMCNSAVPEKDDFKTHVDLGLNFPSQNYVRPKLYRFLHQNKQLKN